MKFLIRRAFIRCSASEKNIRFRDIDRVRIMVEQLPADALLFGRIDLAVG